MARNRITYRIHGEYYGRKGSSRKSSSQNSGVNIDSYQVALDGLINVKLAALPVNIQKGVLDKATRRANRILLKAFKEVVPVKTGALKRSMSVKVKKYERGEIVFGTVGPRIDYVEMIPILKGANAGKQRLVRPANYVHLVDAGTRQRQTKAGKNRGKVNARLFIHEAKEKVRNEIAQIFNAEIDQA
ncbi:MAG: HK97 gp10 family phage protein, partial [Planctomycetaceae bacterium]|nr:HK97 gp10 family phage protein [Planctomycetaceae bacterium]